jgi:hypothetical protein
MGGADINRATFRIQRLALEALHEATESMLVTEFECKISI